MELTLAENIRAFRKERRLTQEQFAEAMGVTVGSVYKWETGQTTPELGMLVDIADFFDISMDVLLGYRVKDNRISAIEERIREYCRSRNPEALSEAEKALKKYPNSFKVVHGCALVYDFFGIGSKDHSETRRALELYEQAKLLISQNHDSEINEQTINGEIANAWMLLGEYEKSIELMKRNNAGGIYSDSIGLVLALYLKNFDEVEPFLSGALLLHTIHLVDSVIGYALVLTNRGNYRIAMKMLSDLMDYLSPLKEGDKADYTDKIMANMYAVMAHVYMLEGKKKEATRCLQEALTMVRQFDSAPDYGIRNLRYPTSHNDIILNDGLGAMAADSMETILRLMDNQELYRMWKEMINVK